MSTLRQRTIVSTLIMFLPLMLAAGPDLKPAAPATQPTALFQETAQFQRVVFLCDASGSMINKMATLKDQLNKTIAGMKPEQKFGVVIMQDKSFDRFKDSLVPADVPQRQAAAKFLEQVTTTGTTDPIPGIEEAFKQKPDVIYLLTDGDFPDNEAVLKRIRVLNKDKKVKVYTIAYVNPTDTDTDFMAMLKAIAKESGGKYSHVNEEETSRQSPQRAE